MNFSKCTPNGPSILANASLVIYVSLTYVRKLRSTSLSSQEKLVILSSPLSSQEKLVILYSPLSSQEKLVIVS